MDTGLQIDTCYAEVAIPVHVSRTFTYSLPFPLRPGARIGSRIIVPLGRRLVTGYIVDLFDHLRSGTTLQAYDIKDAKQILDVVPIVPDDILQLTRWVSGYYAVPWGEVIKAALPPGISPTTEDFFTITAEGERRVAEVADLATVNSQILSALAEGERSHRDLLRLVGQGAPAALRRLEKQGLVERIQRSGRRVLKPKRQLAVRLLATKDPDDQKLSEAQRRVLTVLQEYGKLSLQELLTRARAGVSSVNSLQKRGIVETFYVDLRRDPLAGNEMPNKGEYRLTEAQASVLQAIKEPLRQGAYAAFLLHGVTSSGKTEVYVRAMRVALQLHRGAIMLVPEIALTPVFSRQLRAQFGDQVAIFHSLLSKGERYDEWARVRNGEARIVIGTRSAVFAPVKNLGLIIVDEEHESSYRQQDSPQYNARDTAVVRAQNQSAVVVLGSATPSLESFHNARTGKYSYLHLAQRIGNRPLATAQIIDMRQVFARHKRRPILSDELLQAIQQTRERDEQAIILLNRRGYSTFLLCRSCGETIQCPNCDVTLTYHRSERVIVCHYCNHRERPPVQCPTCQSKYIYYVGEGTEQIEQLLRNLLPTSRIARIDRDTTSRRQQLENTLLEFDKRKIDILVGTQMLAKGHDFPNVTLVGVVSIDAGLAIADFRAAERVFQLITQVAGRAGRGDRPGQVVIQTYHPYHYAVKHSCAQDYVGFYEEEIRHRQNYMYPPFVFLASLVVHGPVISRVKSQAAKLKDELIAANRDRTCRILGPAPAPLSRLKGEHRIQFLLKSRGRRALRRVIDKALETFTLDGQPLRSVNLEIDPVSMM